MKKSGSSSSYSREKKNLRRKPWWFPRRRSFSDSGLANYSARWKCLLMPWMAQKLAFAVNLTLLQGGNWATDLAVLWVPTPRMADG